MKLFGEELKMVLHGADNSNLVSGGVDDNKSPEVRWFIDQDIYWIDREILKNTQGDKILYRYGSHQEGIKAEGYERPFGVSEMIHLLNCYYRNALSSDMRDVVEDMMNGGAEFLSTAIRKDEDSVNMYDQVTQLDSSNEGYIAPSDSWYGSSAYMSIEDAFSGTFTFHEIMEKNPEMYMFLLGYNPHNLDKKATNTILVEIPNDDMLWPYCFKHEHGLNKFYIADIPCGMRGVRLE